MLRAFLCFLLFLLCLAGHAQQSKQYSFKRFTVLNGLAANYVTRVVQDKQGYMWLSTSNGLQRYDGSSFITFKARSNDPLSIPSNHITLLYVDKAGNLWVIGDNDKIGIFDTKKFTFREIPIQAQKGRLFIVQGFQELPSGELILLRADGVHLRYDPSLSRFIPDENVIPHPPKWKMSWVYWDEPLKKYWIACDSGLVQYDPKTRHLNYRGHNIDRDPVIKAFENQLRPATLITDSANNLIFVYWPPNAGSPEIHRYNRKKGKAEKFNAGYPGYHEVGYFLKQRNGRLWVYGLPFLAEWSDRQGSSFVHVRNEYLNEHSIKFDYMHDMYEDRENNIWLATDNGLYYFNPDEQIFNTYYVVKPGGSPFEATVTSIQELKDGRIFVGCWGTGGITAYDNQLNPIPLPDKIPAGDHSAWDMAVHPKTNDLWITMQGGSIIVLNSKTNKFKRFTPEVFGGSTIRQVDEDTSGNLWFGTHNGKVIKWDYKKSGGDPAKGYQLILQTGLVHKIHYDYQGYIWVATLLHGLVKIDARTHEVVKVFKRDGKPGERLFTDSPGDMTYYNDSTLIVTANCLNIINTKTNQVTWITAEDGLPSNTVQSVERDESGIVWVGLTNGLCRMNLEKKVITYYDRRDGIIDDEFLMGGAKELADGRLIFLTDHNFIVFDPTKFGHQVMPPRPHITNLSLSGRMLNIDSIFQDKRALLKYNKTSIAINFSALSYLQQRKIYYYKLEGLDKDWIRTDEPIQVIYNYLEPGDYYFRVKSGNADGMMNEQEVVLPITVRPPFWKTWWFYSLIGLLIITILYLLDKERMDRIRSVQQMRRQIRKNLAEEISTTLNNITVLSEIAKIKADKNVVQAKDFIDQISEKSKHMVQALDDTLWSLDPHNDSMKQTLLRIRELTDNLRTAYRVEIDLIVDNKVQEIELDMKIRHEFYFYYKEAIDFVINQLHCKQVFVNINKVKSRLMIEILSESEEPITGAETKFTAALNKRLSSLPGSLDLLADANSFSALLYIHIR